MTLIFNTYTIVLLLLLPKLFYSFKLIFLSPHSPYEAKVSPYECGFIGEIYQTREIFSIQFILVALLFLPFDMELVAFFPIVPSYLELEYYGYTTILIFFLILTLGFILELGSGAISLINYTYEKEKNNINISNF
uniref:NADH-ubiquinone oxidoreductase chain 3 n=1 Tax=Flammulina velutipes TaxID=38945 RepID=A0A0A0MZN0_FLAVE|nr:NADH dehydrogenase subunit 3 [Flammulina velutipes]